MKSRAVFFWFALTAILVAALALNVGVSQAGGIVALATAGYDVTFGGAERTVSFAAQKDSSGVSRGQGELFNHVTGTRIHYDIDCLSVSGNVATISGAITHTDTTIFPVGTPIWLRVKDNGEGPNKPRDLVTPLFAIFGPPVPCTVTIATPTLLIESGNITVH